MSEPSPFENETALPDELLFAREKTLLGFNYRDYGKNDLALLKFIRAARDLGFSMAQVRELLDLADDRSRSCVAVDELARAHLADVDRKIAELSSLRNELARLLSKCEQGSIEDCLIIEALGQQG